jgi:hypothetical protein
MYNIKEELKKIFGELLGNEKAYKYCSVVEKYEVLNFTTVVVKLSTSA